MVLNSNNGTELKNIVGNDITVQIDQSFVWGELDYTAGPVNRRDLANTPAIAN